MSIKKFKALFIALVTIAVSSCTLPSTSSSSSGSTSSSTSSEVNPLIPQYTISFYLNGGTGTPDSIMAPAGMSIGAPQNPFRTGYIFEGWYEDYGVWESEFVFDVMPERNVVLYAHWTNESDEAVNAYRDYLASISQPNHLYIHYRRFNQTSIEYANWDIWLWPENATGRMVDFKKDGDNVYFDDYGGAMIEVDLTTVYQDGGHDGSGNRGTQTVNFFPDETLVARIGFLITYRPSRSSGTHWVSDGGDKFLVTATALEHGYNGSLHVFAVQENVKDFTYKYGGETFVNPYEDDDGTNVSAKYNNVDSSGTPDPIAVTSEDLYGLGVGYQIMVPSFADSDGDGMGDIRGILENLDYFEYLNVEVLWLTPIQLSDSYHGYDTIDYRRIDTKFGSRTSPHAVEGNVTHKSAMLDYVDLILEARSRNIKIVMDLVVNHTSINNVLFQESLSLNPEYRAYYHWRNHEVETLNQFWHPYSTYDYSFYGKFASSMPELNYDYQATRDVMIDIMDYWVTLGVAGFRIDAVKHVYMQEEIIPSPTDVIITDSGSSVNYNSNLTKNLHFFRELNGSLKEKHPEAFIVGENFDGHAYRVAPYYEGLDSMLNFYMYYNLMQAAANGDRQPTYRVASKVAGAYIPEGGDNFVPNVQSNPTDPDTKVNVPYGGSWNYPGVRNVFNRYRSNNNTLDTKAVDGLFTSNHDLVRPVNKITGTLGASGDISGRGTISSANAAHATEMALATNAATILLPGLSWIYYGDELGMSSNLPTGIGEQSPHADRFARQPFKWNQDNSSPYMTGYTFSGDQTYEVSLDSYNQTLPGVAEQMANESSMLSNIKRLTALKANSDALKTGAYEAIPLTQYQSSYNVFAFKRFNDTETYSVYINMSNTAVSLSGVSGDVAISIKGATTTSLPAWGVLVTLA
jgi:uncharacterized repeat protein (TIGR02543 family)